MVIDLCKSSKVSAKLRKSCLQVVSWNIKKTQAFLQDRRRNRKPTKLSVKSDVPQEMACDVPQEMLLWVSYLHFSLSLLCGLIACSMWMPLVTMSKRHTKCLSSGAGAGNCHSLLCLNPCTMQGRQSTAALRYQMLFVLSLQLSALDYILKKNQPCHSQSALS